MSEKILVNALTMEGANLTPLILKTQQWLSVGCAVTLIGGEGVQKRVEDIAGKGVYDFIVPFPEVQYRSFLHYMYEAITRNMRMVFRAQSMKGVFSVVYTISSVLDLIIFPWCLKFFDKKIKWCSVFDNTVPFNQAGNMGKRFLAWVFFKLSLVLLKKADHIFVISRELRGFLIQQGFRADQLIVTGNGIEKDVIERANPDASYAIDLLYVGRINAAKGVYDILKVLMLLKQRNNTIQLAIMGTGNRKAEDDFRSKISDMGLSSNVQLLGFRNGLEKFRIMKGSKCFISLSPNESYGVALLEAVSCGLESFVYDLPVYREIYRENEIQSFAISDTDSVAQAISWFLTNPSHNQLQKNRIMHVRTWGDIAQIELQAMQTV